MLGKGVMGDTPLGKMERGLWGYSAARRGYNVGHTMLGTCSHGHLFRFKEPRFRKAKCLAQGHRANECGAAGQPGAA